MGGQPVTASVNQLQITKARTGIDGFDDLTHGGLPQGRSILVSGAPGSGKTLSGVEFLVRGEEVSSLTGTWLLPRDTESDGERARRGRRPADRPGRRPAGRGPFPADEQPDKARQPGTRRNGDGMKGKGGTTTKASSDPVDTAELTETTELTTVTAPAEPFPPDDDPAVVFELRLYVAEQSPKPVHAIENLRALCEEHLSKLRTDRWA